MTRIELTQWAAWAPGIVTREDWEAWARAPQPLVGGGAPEVSFMPALHRRRCDALSRAVLAVAHECCPEPLLSSVASVFATRHGPFSTTVALLEDLATGSPLSPARFTHSVHNAPSGLFSIWAKNPWPSSTVAGGAETFACGFLEAVTMLHREAGRPVLLVVADEVVPDPFQALAERLDSTYAVALLLGDGQGEGSGSLGFRLDRTQATATSSAWPDALEFLRWWLSGERKLCLARGPRAWVWSRDDRGND